MDDQQSPPIAAPLKPVLLAAAGLQGSPCAAGSSAGSRSPRAGSCHERPRPGAARSPQRSNVTRTWSSSQSACTRCRHTYASFLVAAGYTLRELMEYMGHSSLQATERYVKLLPQPAGPDGAADRATPT